jgi:hypothetical protein
MIALKLVTNSLISDPVQLISSPVEVNATNNETPPKIPDPAEFSL